MNTIWVMVWLVTSRPPTGGYAEEYKTREECVVVQNKLNKASGAFSAGYAVCAPLAKRV